MKQGFMQSAIPIGNPPITQDWLGIWYSPIGNEPDPATLQIVREFGLQPWIVIPSDAKIDPFEYAERLKKEYATTGANRRVYLFIPGQAFDVTGTRLGRGGGWCDRFLSRLPADWLKIGVVPSGNKTDALLERRPWDVPMDWLLVE